MNNRRQYLITGALILIVAAVGSLLRYGYPPSDGWVKFIGVFLFFTAVESPMLTYQYSKRSCAGPSGVRKQR